MKEPLFIKVLNRDLTFAYQVEIGSKSVRARNMFKISSNWLVSIKAWFFHLGAKFVAISNLQGRCLRCVWRGHLAKQCCNALYCFWCKTLGHRRFKVHNISYCARKVGRRKYQKLSKHMLKSCSLHHQQLVSLRATFSHMYHPYTERCRGSQYERYSQKFYF